jgi:hypothetical protein
MLTGRWKTLRHSTISPTRIGAVVAAALQLTHFEYRYLSESRCRVAGGNFTLRLSQIRT